MILICWGSAEVNIYPPENISRGRVTSWFLGRQVDWQLQREFCGAGERISLAGILCSRGGKFAGRVDHTIPYHTIPYIIYSVTALRMGEEEHAASTAPPQRYLPLESSRAKHCRAGQVKILSPSRACIVSLRSRIAHRMVFSAHFFSRSRRHRRRVYYVAWSRSIG